MRAQYNKKRVFMHNIFKSLLAGLIVCGATSDALAIDTPDALAAQLRSAIESKDIEAASKLVEWRQAPITAYRMFKMSVADCFAPASCKIETAAISEQNKAPHDDYYFPIAPQGEIKIIPPQGGDGFSMPFAKINDSYRIVIGQQSDKAYQETKNAANARNIAQELDPDLLSSGDALPADGGEPLKAYREYLAAIARGDSTFLAQAGASGDRYYFGKAYKDNPLKTAITIDLIRMESVNEPKIQAGFIRDNRALLLVSGTNGQGWNTEGAITLMKDSDRWAIEDTRYVSYPPTMNQ